jgi:hypothetical protein
MENDRTISFAGVGKNPLFSDNGYIVVLNLAIRFVYRE